MAELPSLEQPYLDRFVLDYGRLCRFGDLDDHRHVERGQAAGAPLSGGNPGEFSLEVDIGGHGMGANGTVGEAFKLILNECFHDESLTSSDAELEARVVPKP
jgi:hypothetical protein